MFQELLVAWPNSTIEAKSKIPVRKQTLKARWYVRPIQIFIQHELKVLNQIRKCGAMFDHPLEFKYFVSLTGFLISSIIILPCQTDFGPSSAVRAEIIFLILMKSGPGYQAGFFTAFRHDRNQSGTS